MQNKIFSILIIGWIIFFSGCTPLYVSNKQFKQNDIQRQSAEKGYVLFSDFDIPQPVTRSFRFVNNVPQVDSVTIYDVTEGINLVGYLVVNPPVHKGQDYFVETYLPTGKRTLMLIWKTLKGFPLIGMDKYTDFIEVDVSKENVTHISISEYPWKKQNFISNNFITWPKFTLIKVDDKAFDFCSQNTGDQISKENNIDTFMKQLSLNAQQKYFKDYCLMLSSEHKNIIIIKEKFIEEAMQEKTEIENIKNNNFPEWQKSKDKNKSFNMINSK